VKIKIGLMLVSLMMAIMPVQAAQDVNSENPYLMVQEVGMRTFDRMKHSKQQISENPELLRTIMEEELLPYIDYQYTAFKVLGKHFDFKAVGQEKLVAYVRVFRQYLVTSYADAMSYYDNQEVVFAPAQDYKGEKTVTVRALIKDASRPDIKVAFKVRKSKGNEWKAYDMVAEGISMLNNEINQYEPIMRKEGIDKVMALMQDKIDRPLELKSLDDANNPDTSAEASE
jgi:phospholipid transport system substrate-binding protein